MSENKNFGLGRIFFPDDRDQLYPLSAIVPAAPKRAYKYHNANGWWGNQQDLPQCVGYSLAHFLEDGPIGQPGTAPVFAPQDIYDAAREVDQWPGTDYEGTSVRAGAAVLKDKGFLESYHWGYSLQDMIDATFQQPTVMGTNWYSKMFEPNDDGVIKVGGSLAGGHAYVVDGVNTVKRLFRIKNSWGRSWGQNGFAFISFEDMERLISENGEVAFLIEKVNI